RQTSPRDRLPSSLVPLILASRPLRLILNPLSATPLVLLASYTGLAGLPVGLTQRAVALLLAGVLVLTVFALIRRGAHRGPNPDLTGLAGGGIGRPTRPRTRTAGAATAVVLGPGLAVVS